MKRAVLFVLAWATVVLAAVTSALLLAAHDRSVDEAGPLAETLSIEPLIERATEPPAAGSPPPGAAPATN